MWQHHYLIHAMRMDELRAEAERENRWRLADEANDRPAQLPAPGPAREILAGLLASVSRAAGRIARRLDERVGLDLGPDRLLRDA